MSDSLIPFGSASLNNCDREQIHIPGSIQPHGVLLAMELGSLKVIQVGGDIEALLEVDAAHVLGSCPADIGIVERLSPSDWNRLRTMKIVDNPSQNPRHVFSFSTRDKRIDAAAHVSQGFLVLELEPAREEDPEDSISMVQEMIQRVRDAKNIESSYQAIVDSVREASGFDRVMLYRFLSDGTGSVEAEARHEGVASYLGLRYPASDIPAPARELYRRNWIRVIPDARYRPSPLVAYHTWPVDRSLDLSHSILRSVSPIHLEYLANMGVVGSMSLSIILDGALWGLIACHSLTPRYPSYRRRMALELFAQMASFQLETKLKAEDLGSRLHQKSIKEALITGIFGQAEIANGLRLFQPKLLEYIRAEGIALWIDGQFSSYGKTPKADDTALLVRWLNETMTDGVFHTEQLPAIYPSAVSFANVASGMLALSVSRTPRDYVIWFKPEVVHTVTWAGNPDKPVEMSDTASGRISPRKSFAAWKQQVRLRSEPWSLLDVRTAQSLRLSLLEIILEHTDQISRERERARVQQQALLAELDQRIAQWEAIAKELKQESDRRVVVEAELSQVLRNTVLEQEAERQHIARELHDSLGQYLTIMRLDLDGIGRDSEASDSIRQRVEKLKSLTANVGQEINHLAWEIRPTALDDLGLQKAFQQFLEEWEERSPLKFDVHLSLDNRRLSPTIETTLYRVLQEAIRNVVKHAKANKVGVILEASTKEVRLIVEDDGIGFLWYPDKGTSGSSRGLGLLGVRERLALVGGVLEVETSPNSGTTLIIHVPLNE